MIVLGLNVFHADAAACLVRDGRVVAAVAEERLGTRVKHFAGFPARAIRAVLDAAGVSIEDVDAVAVGHDPRANLGAKAAYALRHPRRALGSALTLLSRGRQLEALPETIARSLGVDAGQCRFRTLNVEHHLAHLASSFYGSRFGEAAGFSYDASGDFVSGAYASCDGDVAVIDRVVLPHSLGYFYTAICQFIGFDEFGEEYKVMGLAAYGRPRYLALMQRLLAWAGRGQYRIDPRYFSGLLRQSHEELAGGNGRLVIPPLYSAALVDELGPPRRREAEITERDRDLAASCQLHFENVVVECLRWLHDQVPSDALVTAGGCALNGVCNARILRDTPFRRHYAHAAAGDDGTAVGAALYAWRALASGRPAPVSATYWGPAHGEAEQAAARAAAGVPAERLEMPALVARVADHLAAGRVVGWYQGRSEFGPRALGNRSILAHPGWPGMQDLINAKVKRREPFRPFAPSILAERVADYFEQTIESPFMMHVVKIREERRRELAAVCHVDGTGRLHTVTREQNPLYHALLVAFAERTGTPVLLNTSFNENEPIVDTPAQAVDCFVRTDIDVLCLGPFVAEKKAAA
ncbi:MAG: carbamoyltransferase [Gemmatimonadota bacterium]